MLNGGCCCGFVRYVADGAPFHETICHCSICRRASGAPFVAWFSVKADEFKLVSGEPAQFSSSEHAERTFCPRCGTALTFRSSRFSDELDVTTCSLDEPECVPPKDQTHTRSQVSWVNLADGLPNFPESRSP